METMNVALPVEMKEFVRDEVSQGGYSSTSEYIRALIRGEQKRKAEARLEALLLEGLNSGERIEVTDEYWQKKRAELLKRHQGRQND
ncbi:MAG: type II toxin-antitoxin system ParD family antitoxin [bacterium]